MYVYVRFHKDMGEQEELLVFLQKSWYFDNLYAVKSNFVLLRLNCVA